MCDVVFASTYPAELSLSKRQPTEMSDLHMEVSSISHITHNNAVEQLMKGCDG